MHCEHLRALTLGIFRLAAWLLRYFTFFRHTSQVSSLVKTIGLDVMPPEKCRQVLLSIQGPVLGIF